METSRAALEISRNWDFFDPSLPLIYTTRSDATLGVVA